MSETADFFTVSDQDLPITYILRSDCDPAKPPGCCSFFVFILRDAILFSSSGLRRESVWILLFKAIFPWDIIA
jgi:hypothetical protein